MTQQIADLQLFPGRRSCRARQSAGFWPAAGGRVHAGLSPGSPPDRRAEGPFVVGKGSGDRTGRARPPGGPRGPKSHRCRSFPLGPPVFVEVTWWLRTQKGARSSPTRSEAGTGCGRGGAAQPWGASLGRSRRTRAEKLQWAVWGVGVFFPGPIAAPSCASARLSPSPPRPGAGVTVSGDFLCAAVGHAPSLRGPTGETQACVP